MAEAEERLSKRVGPGADGSDTGLGYLLYLPPGYYEQPDKRWPVVFFLHGAGERGSDLEIVKYHGLPKVIDQGQDFPFIAVAPQCPTEERWTQQLAKLDRLYAQIMENYRVLPDQIYLTGLSMGGQGTWFWSTSHPDRFAAIIAICGRSFPEKAESIKHLQIKVFHGDTDDVVPLEESTKMAEALKAVEADVEFTVYPGVGHDSWSMTYTKPELYEWLLAQHR